MSGTKRVVSGTKRPTKPEVFKLAGAWVWRCHHASGDVGDVFWARCWHQAWAACYAAAVKHWELYHDESGEVVAVVELDVRPEGDYGG